MRLCINTLLLQYIATNVVFNTAQMYYLTSLEVRSAEVKVLAGRHALWRLGEDLLPCLVQLLEAPPPSLKHHSNS